METIPSPLASGVLTIMQQSRKPTHGHAYIAYMLLKAIIVSNKLEQSFIQFKTVKQMLKELTQKILETKSIKVCIGKDKKPIDKEEDIIFHIDI